MQIRRATADDEYALARIHTLSWQDAYVGLVPQDYLDGLTVEKRLPMWRNILTGSEVHAYVAQVNDEIAGFVTVRVSDEEPGSADVGAIYLLRQYWRQSIGTALWQRACEDAAERGLSRVLAWVVEGNTSARSFYRSVGCADSGKRKVITIGGQDIFGVRVDWQPPSSDPDGREFVLSVDDFDLAAWADRQQPAANGVSIIALADIASDTSAAAVGALYELALQVHVKPNWELDEYLERFDDWRRVFLALHDETCVGYTYSRAHSEVEGALRQGMTAVLPDWRRQGIGLALKLATIVYARENGFTRIVTSNSSSRTEMIQLNEKLGFVDQPA